MAKSLIRSTKIAARNDLALISRRSQIIGDF